MNDLNIFHQVFQCPNHGRSLLFLLLCLIIVLKKTVRYFQQRLGHTHPGRVLPHRIDVSRNGEQYAQEVAERAVDEGFEGNIGGES